VTPTGASGPVRRDACSMAEGPLPGLVDELPAPERVAPLAFIDDELLPRAMAPVEPAAFVLTCIQAVWGSHGLRN
jgi:hypothetical protein